MQVCSHIWPPREGSLPRPGHPTLLQLKLNHDTGNVFIASMHESWSRSTDPPREVEGSFLQKVRWELSGYTGPGQCPECGLGMSWVCLPSGVCQSLHTWWQDT